MTATNKITLKNPTGKREENMKDIMEMIEKQNNIGSDIDLLIRDQFKVEDLEGIAKIKELLAMNLLGPDSIVPTADFVVEPGVLKEFESDEEMKQVIWDTFTDKNHKQCSAEVFDQISKVWNINKYKTNRVLAVNEAWFTKLKKKKVNGNGLAVYYFKAKA